MTRDDLEAITWRILASLAAGLAPGEKVSLTLVGDRTTSWLEVELPASMAKLEDVFAYGTRGDAGRGQRGRLRSGLCPAARPRGSARGR